MTQYRQVYTRENSLIAIQIWEEHQCRRLQDRAGGVAPLSIFDIRGGVARVYYRTDTTDVWERIILGAAECAPGFISRMMREFGEQLDRLEPVWKKGVVGSTSELEELFDTAVEAWVGVSISYFLPTISSLSQEEQGLGMTLRQRSVDFLERTDHVVQDTLHALYPELGELVKYLLISDMSSGILPEREVLEQRQEHCVYYNFEFFVDTDLETLARRQGIVIVVEPLPSSMVEIIGQTAMGGRVEGIVRVIRQKSQIPLLQEGEILVTAMTTPDYLPAMQRAAAFVTDEGGIMCHAAIVAREFSKPCIVGTRIAMRALQDGDRVEVDGERGIVRILEKN